MSNSSKKLLDLIKQTSKSTNELNSKIISLKINKLNPLEFIYNEKLILDKQFYVLDKNFSLTNLKDDQGNVYDLQVGDTVTAMMTNNGQTYYILANKSVSSGGGGGGSSDYSDLDNKPQINNVTLTGNKTTSDLGISIPTKTSDLQNDSGFLVAADISGKQDTLTAGTNITISGTTISATDTTYNNATIYNAGLMSSADKLKLDNTFKELVSPVRIWDLNDGAYKLPSNCIVYYYGATNTAKKYTTWSTAYLFIIHDSDFKQYYMFESGGSQCYIINGSSDSSSGTKIEFNLANSYLTKISSYVKNNLTYSTSNTTYALSAYQGYVLNQNKENVSNKVTSISSSSTDTQYPSAKLLYDQLALKTNHDNVAKDFWYGTQAEYDTLATKDANTIYMTDGIDYGDIYSTTEQRVGTWIDGKPVYEITIVNYSVTLSNNYALIGQLDVSVDHFVSANWAVGNPSAQNNAWRTGYLSSDYYSGIQVSMINNQYNIYIFAKDSTTNPIKVMATIRYTKTTD